MKYKLDSELGTPKTLSEAINRGILGVPLSKVHANTHAAIRDFLSQKFTVAEIRELPLRELWFLIFPEERKESE